VTWQSQVMHLRRLCLLNNRGEKFSPSGLAGILLAVEGKIATFEGDQFRMGSHLHHRATIHHHNLIRPLDGSEAVGDEDDGAIAKGLG